MVMLQVQTVHGVTVSLRKDLILDVRTNDQRKIGFDIVFPYIQEMCHK